ncbi:MAG: oligosaccharide flippase family protein [Flavobacteriales bacterium]|nr:oligosaccharide flippase family protein [Flavobacteriales bacterium]
MFSANSLIHLIEFGSQLFVAWILLADDIGRIKSLQTFASVGVIIAGLGFNTSILKLCSEKDVTDEEKQTLFASAIKTTLLFSFLTILLAIVLSFFNLISKDTLTNNLFLYYSLSIPLLALNNLLVAYYQALKAFKKVSVLLVIARIIHVAIIISLTYLFGLNGFIIGVIIGFLISTLLLLSKTEFLKTWKKTTSIHFKKNWDLAKYAFLGNTINMLSLYLDIFFLNHLVNNPEEIGFYGFALTLIAGLRIVTSTAQQFVTPYYSEFSSNVPQILKAFKKSNQIFGATILVVGVLAILIVPLVIHFVFSGKYDASMFYFQILTLSWIIRSWVSLKGPFLLAIGYVHVAFKVSLWVFLITILPYWYAVKVYQIQGALYGQVFVSIVFFIVVNISFKQVLKKLYH